MHTQFDSMTAKTKLSFSETGAAIAECFGHFSHKQPSIMACQFLRGELKKALTFWGT